MYIALALSLLLSTFARAMDEDVSIGTPNTASATKVLMLGSGELGKEVFIELGRLGVELHAVDKYENAPAMHVTSHRHVINMMDGGEIERIVKEVKPDFVVPEIEAIDTTILEKFEKQGITVIPTARAVEMTMNRKRIRRRAHEDLELPTSNYRFADNLDEFRKAVKELGSGKWVSKPLMSSSGKGQWVGSSEDDIEQAWEHAQTAGRVGGDSIMVEEFIDFDYEITMITVRQKNGPTLFCEPVGHKQIKGDYRESWQPHPMSKELLDEIHGIAQTITDDLGGQGVFGVEIFVKDGEPLFSEVSPRPHDTGMVTLISQNKSEFKLHAHAILGLPIPNITQHGPAASTALLLKADSDKLCYDNLQKVLKEEDTDLRLFGKPEIHGERRMGVVVALGKTIKEACAKANRSASSLKLKE